MARQGRLNGRREDLLQTANNLTNMLRQLEAASVGSQRGEAGESHGGGMDKRHRDGSRARDRGRSWGTGQRGHYMAWRDKAPPLQESPASFMGQSEQHYPWGSHWQPQRGARKQWGGQTGRGGYRNWQRYEDEGSCWGQERRPQGHQQYQDERRYWGVVGVAKERQGDRIQIEPSWLVEVLAQQPTFSASMLQLLEEQQLTPATVRATVSHHPHVFCLQSEQVQLRPQLDICAGHCGPQGCLDCHACTNLHICPMEAVGRCDNGKKCVLGHHWHTNHNLTVLRPLFLDHLRYPVLRELLQFLFSSKEEDQDQGPLTVCVAYNNSGCEQADCQELHVCLSFVTEHTRCSRTDCQLNHDLLSPSCCHLLQLHGLSTNESPRDIVVALLQANPNLALAEKEQQQYQTTKKNHPMSTKKLDTRKESSGWKTTLRDKLQKVKATEDSDSQSLSEENLDLSDYVQDESNPVRNSDKKKATSSLNKTNSKKVIEKDSEGKSESVSSFGSESESESNNSDEFDKKKMSKKSQNVMIDKKKATSSLKTKTNKKVIEKDSEGKSESVSSFGSESESESSNSDEFDEKKMSKKSQNVIIDKDVSRPIARRKTLWAHYLLGDVTTPEICYHSVEGMCSLEGGGCPRLHAMQYFHWQAREQTGSWINLQSSQVTCLERAFCDPRKNGVDLPRLDPATLDRSMNGLLLLLGRETWYADFPDTAAFTLTDSSKTKTLKLRRLCTEVLPDQANVPITFAWYFQDKNKAWVKYGKVDTTGETNLVSSITSNDIEKQFKQNPSLPLSFKNSKFTYILDLLMMKQTNQNTNVSRTVRRRPDPHLPAEQEEKKGSGQTASSDLPSHWEIMQEKERMKLVTLAPTSSEYQTVVGLVAGKVSSSMLLKVERIQNPWLWHSFQNKIKELTVVYSDASKVDIRQLFHGTSYNVVASICALNFDWRLHGSASGQKYGRGTYFSTDAAYSYNYCHADPSGLKYMFVAKVAVGSLIQGNSSMVRPPTNPATSYPFDSTVNSASNPSIIVKYEQQEYYPEFILTFS